MSKGDARSMRHNRRRRQAREWFVLMEPNKELPPALRKKWERWRQDERNLSEFNAYQRVDRLLRASPQRALPTYEELHGRPRTTASRASHQRRLTGFATAASDVLTGPCARRAYVLVFLGALVWIGIAQIPPPRIYNVPRAPEEQVYQSQPGKRLTIHLADDSVVRLGGNSRLRVLLSGECRYAVLERGEAMFKVTRNPRCPFAVDVGAAHITDVGTEFHVQVYESDKQVTVVVAEGAVNVVPRPGPNGGPSTSRGRLKLVKVSAGQAVSADATGRIKHVPAEFQAQQWWDSGRRDYVDKPVNKVIEDLQLYSQRPIEYDPGLASFTFTGTVYDDKLGQWLNDLSKMFPVEMDESNPGRLVIRCRKTNCGR